LTSGQTNSALEEVIQLLREISSREFIESKGGGDRGVGFTLEELLGIKSNSSKNPDYKGIELKTTRRTTAGRLVSRRKGLFSQVPDWPSSALDERQLVQKYGYRRPGSAQLRLYCTVGATPNPQSLFLISDEVAEIIENLAKNSSGGDDKVLQWSTVSLQDALRIKHPETLWITAENRINSAGIEEFHYVEAIYTKSPLVHNFGPLVTSGSITVDFTIKGLASGATKNHGYLFKITPRSHHLLFPNPVVFKLT
jgi:hypothetical protein